MSGGTTAVSLAAVAISTAVNMYAQNEQQKQQSRAQKASAQYNAQVAEDEKAVQAQLANAERAKGAAEASRVARTAQRHMGEQRSALASSGFEMDSGTSLSMLADSAAEAQYDINVTRQNAEWAAWEHDVASNRAQNNVNFANYQGSQADAGKTGSMLGMGGTLLGGIASGLNTFNSYQNTKTPGSGYNVTNGGNPQLNASYGTMNAFQNSPYKNTRFPSITWGGRR